METWLFGHTIVIVLGMATPQPRPRGRPQTSPRGRLELVPRFRVPSEDLAVVLQEAASAGMPPSRRFQEIVEAHVTGRPTPLPLPPPHDLVTAIRRDASLDMPARDLLVALLEVLRDRRG